MSDTPEFLSQRLRHEGAKTSAFFKELSAADWEKTVYADTPPWTVHQLFAHFVSAEENLFWLVRDIQAGGRGAPEGFDIDRFNQREVAQMKSASPASLLERFQELRQQTSAWIALLKQEDLDKRGWHPFLGLAPLTEVVKLIYRHNQIHQRDIRKALA